MDPEHCLLFFPLIILCFLCAGAEFRQHGGSGGIRARALLLRAAARPHQGPRERGPRQGPTHGALHQVGGAASSSVVEPEPQEQELFHLAKRDPECIPVPDPDLDPDLT
jgi:hypothetical protein